MLNSDDSLLIIVDIQEKLVKMLESDNIHINASKLFQTAEILNIPIIVTEQYPKGLGATIAELQNKNCKYYEKTAFNALLEEQIFDALKSENKNQILLCGIETHICVLQTALALLENDYEVYIIQDACGSRKKENYLCALRRLEKESAVITDVETTIFELLKTSKHPNFKEIQALIK